MKIALSGARGIVGRWIAQSARQAGHDVTELSRPDYHLGDRPDLTGYDALIHAAFQHLPGRYRGGEGDDPQGFTKANLDGTLALFQAAKASGVGRAVFVSSRAVFDGYPDGTELLDDMPLRPTSLYGEVKARAETAIAAMADDRFRTASLRPTGVFGAGTPQKWAGLIGDFLAGRPTPSRVATEVHGADLGAAALLVLGDPAMAGGYNVSDLILDHHDLLSGVAALTGAPAQPPMRDDAAVLRIQNCARLWALGWLPDGLARLHEDLPLIIAQSG